jgi:predicted alpha-1,2-mannosidase
MKRFLKWVLRILCVLVLLPVLGVVGVWGLYYSVVREKPGAMPVNVTPGELGVRVNPFIGTGGVPWMCAHDTPAATTPFGMVRLGPDTASILINETGLNRSGYFYGDNKIIGFSHTRLVGADALEGGVFRVFPTTDSRVEQDRRKDRFARFSHRYETAFPGYYAVRLPKNDVLVELTATPHVGIHRYTFGNEDAPHLLVDITSKLGDRLCKDGVAMVKSAAHEVEGTAKTFGSFSGRYGGLDVYFVARFSEPFAKFSTWNGSRFEPGAESAAGDDIGVDLCFEKRDKARAIEVRLALSCVSIANARMNLDAEAPATRKFEDLYTAARDAWENRLPLIRVQGGTERQQRIFCTALYHAFQMPTWFSDVNGEYMGFDRNVHKAEGSRYYTDFSLWDSFRTVHPLYNLIARKDESDMMKSLVEMAKAGGCLPRWPSGCGYTNCMYGTPADVAVSEAYLKGISDFDIETAYKAMRRTALEGVPAGSKFAGRKALEWYLKYGYSPSDKADDSVATTLDFGWSDHALSLLAARLGRNEDAEVFAKHAQSFRNVWNPETQHFEPKNSQGEFPKERNFLVLTYLDSKRRYTRGYVEGSGEQWRWAVPYDAEGLISLFKSREYFVSELETYFEKSKPRLGNWNPGPYYWHGNEPYIHSAYLFNAAGRPDLTQKWVRWVLDKRYDDDYVGLDGNDDGGTLSSWYVFSALGFYPIAGTTKYEIGSPLFSKAEVNLGDKVLTIIAENNSPENIHVRNVWLNDVLLERRWFTHEEIAQGGTLRFEMCGD